MTNSILISTLRSVFYEVIGFAATATALVALFTDLLISADVPAREHLRAWMQHLGHHDLSLAIGTTLIAITRVVVFFKYRATDAALSLHTRAIRGWLAVAIWLTLALIVALIVLVLLQDEVWPVWKSHFAWLLPLGLLASIGEILRRQRQATDRTWGATAKRSVLVIAIVFLSVGLPGIVIPDMVKWLQAAVDLTLASKLALLSGPLVLWGGVMLHAVFVRLSPRKRVFVSFMHEREPTAIAIHAAFVTAGYDVLRVPYDKTRLHDELLTDIQRLIRSCDAVICLPGERQSFVEHEVLVSSTLRKMIIFVLDEKHAQLPNTSFYGYPCFRLRRVERRRFRPVIALLDFAYGHQRDARSTPREQENFGENFWGEFWQSLPPIEKQLPYWALLIILPYLVAFAVAWTYGSLNDAWGTVLNLHNDVVTLVPPQFIQWFVVLYATGIALAIPLAAQMGLRRLLRQTVLSGKATRSELKKLLMHLWAGRILLACLYASPPKPRHEAEISLMSSAQDGKPPSDRGTA